MNWEGMSVDGDHSPYISELDQILRDYVPVIADVLTDTYHQMLWTHLARRLIQSYLTELFKTKRIGTQGAIQLKLDCVSLKQRLEGMPKLGDAERRVGKAYKPFLDAQFGAISAILSVLLTPDVRNVTQMFMETCAEKVSSKKRRRRAKAAPTEELKSRGKGEPAEFTYGHHMDLKRLLEVAGGDRKFVEAQVNEYNRTVPKSRQRAQVIPADAPQNSALLSHLGIGKLTGGLTSVFKR